MRPSSWCAACRHEAGDYADPGPTFGSKLRDRAIILNSLIVLGDLDHAGPVARAISDELASGHWYSTQSVAYALMAMGRLAGADKQGNVFAFEQSVGNAQLKAVRSDKPVYTAKLAGVPGCAATRCVFTTPRTSRSSCK